jgi:PAS domain S-box-containing protein
MTPAGWPSLFWTAFRRSHNAMVLLDDRMLHVEVNGAYLVLLGYRRPLLIGRSITEIVEGGQLMSDDEWSSLASSDNLGEVELVRADGGRVKVDYAAHPTIVTGQRLVLIVALTTTRPHRARRARANAAAARVLSERELQVIDLVALGHSGPEIAHILHITHDTVRTHVRNAQNKLGARSRAQLVALTLGDGHFAEHIDDVLAASA